ncbi:MAG: NADH:flavin oxidoreductase/NADH oxidase family protein [Deltaproteobacteria bacterium]|nr:NADH:flavin oxidoreductase/NADH oxidase family protein [Deltaproteobacteria bacterium]
MSARSALLNRPLKLPCGSVLSNRLGKSALSENLAVAGAPTARLFTLYERWATSGAALLISGNVMVHRDGRGEPGNVVVEDDRHLAALRRWAAAAQSQGAQLWMQVNHVGRQATRGINRRPVAPSAGERVALMGLFAKPRELSIAEIEDLIARYVRAARCAQQAGFAGVQVHAAHGYLISQFLSPRTNKRNDRWGGNAENRRRFLLAIVEQMRRTVGAHFPIGVKLNSADFQRGGFSEDESLEVVEALERAGIDLLEISGGNYESPAMTGLTDRQGRLRSSSAAREAYFLEYAKAVRKRVAVPLMLTGGLRTAATMHQVIADGSVDLIGLGRPLAVEPDLPRRLLDGSAKAALSVNPRVGIKSLDAALAVGWYQRQLHRMADGLDPQLDLGCWSSLGKILWEQLAVVASASR